MLAKKITSWYNANHRKLPWRTTLDPYKIWLSEIILQQTRVNQGLAYYQRFVKKFPDIQTLAGANEDDVMKLWQGLGYYSRARNLHQTAKNIVENFGGNFPQNYDDLLKLKGIGQYTASAIASFAFNQPHAVVDGNVKRVIARIFGVEVPVNTSSGEKHIWKLANEILDKSNPGIFNQAIMEFGALVCMPRNPNCNQCVCKKECFAFNHDKTDQLPIINKSQKKKTIHVNYLVVIDNSDDTLHLIIRKRKSQGIWKNLYDFPSIELERKISPEKLRSTDNWNSILNGIDYQFLKSTDTYRHVLTHRNILARFHIIFTSINTSGKIKNNQRISFDKIENYPVPRLIEKFLDNEMMNLKSLI